MKILKQIFIFNNLSCMKTKVTYIPKNLTDEEPTLFPSLFGLPLKSKPNPLLPPAYQGLLFLPPDAIWSFEDDELVEAEADE